MKKISSIGINIPSNVENFIRLDSFSSLSECDIAIFSADFGETSYSSYSNSSYTGREEYEGKMLYNKESSAKMVEHSKHWNSEIKHFVSNGGTIFIILSKKDDFFIYTGTKDISGTGRNQKVTNHVAPFSNYNFFPFKEITFHSASGKSVYPNDSIVADLHKNFKDLFTFETYIKSDKINLPTFTTKNKDRILGASLKLGNGFVVLIPNITFEIDSFVKYNSKTDKSTWTSEALKKGTIFINCLAEIDKTIRKSEEKTPKPSWVNNIDYNLSEAIKTEQLIKKKKDEIEKRKKEIEELNLLLEEQSSIKDLLFESGKSLEAAVIKALHILGYNAENYDDGVLELDQIIVSPEGERFIGECEGKDNKDIDVSKFRQLLDGLNADFEKDNVTEKAFGLLFGNPQRLILPSERTLSFTQKCISGANREKIGLIRTPDLFRICKYILENGDQNYAKKCRIAIIEQLGQMIIFPEP